MYAGIDPLMRKTIAIGCIALALASCAGEAGPTPGTGIATGVRVSGEVGNGLDEGDRRRAKAAEMQALEYGGPGAPVSWRGERGAYGTIVVGPPYAQGGYARCREYTHTVYILGRPQTTRGVACRNSDGSWTPIG
jgi:surface antigen